MAEYKLYLADSRGHKGKPVGKASIRGLKAGQTLRVTMRQLRVTSVETVSVDEEAGEVLLTEGWGTPRFLQFTEDLVYALQTASRKEVDVMSETAMLAHALARVCSKGGTDQRDCEIVTDLLKGVRRKLRKEHSGG